MYLSQLVLNERDRSVQWDLGNTHTLHQRIMQAFPDEQRDRSRADWNVLFRQEITSNVILVQSCLEPDWSQLPQGYLTNHSIKSFDPQANQLEAGRTLQFRLKANPSKRDKQTGKTIGMSRQPDQIAWLERQSGRYGFKLLGIDVIPTPNVFGVKAKDTPPIKILTVLYQGILQITEPLLFIQTLRQGIGRGKSYGCGLLSIARLHN